MRKKNKDKAEGFFSRVTAPEENPHSATGTYDVVFTTRSEYKNNSIQKKTIPKCYCGTCYVLGSDIIKSVYSLKHMIIEDHNPLIFNPFSGGV